MQGDISSKILTVGKARRRHQREKHIRLCGVCGDISKSYHFGGISCDSCKAFFRRAVLNDTYKNFHCPHSYNCFIDMKSRKFCQYCRFYRCINIGMDKCWVMTDEEKMSVNLQRIEKKLKIAEDQQLSLYHAAKTFEGHNLTMTDNLTINKIIEHFIETIKMVRFPEKFLQQNSFNSLDIVHIFITPIHRIIRFSQSLESFQRLKHSDQVALLKGGTLEMFMIRLTMMYDLATATWPSKNLSYWQNIQSPIMKFPDVKEICKLSTSLYNPQIKFIENMKEMNLDENSLILFSLIVLFSPDRNGLSNPHQVFEEQEKYCLLLHKYLVFCYGRENAIEVYSKIMLKLPELRYIGEASANHYFQMFK